MRDDSEKVPALLTDYILKGKTPFSLPASPPKTTNILKARLDAFGKMFYNLRFHQMLLFILTGLKFQLCTHKTHLQEKSVKY